MRFHQLFVSALLGSVASAQYGAMEMLSPRFGVQRAVDVCPQANQHTCLDVNDTDHCCSDSEYCIIQLDGTPGCCAIGSDCGIVCGSKFYICTTTITTSGSAVASQACCGRACTGTSQFLCPSSLGGQCCQYGYACQSSGCASTQAASSAAVASVIPSGCAAATQFLCASSLGPGCCANGQQCVTSGSALYCSATGTGSVMLTRTAANGAVATAVAKDARGGGLSTGAKAGIGLGVALGALGVIGAVMWFFLVHRPCARRSEKASSVPPAAMSQSSAGRNGGPQRPSAGRQTSQPSDYFGPAAEAGPFTEDPTSPAMSPGSGRGVPATPQSPGDIAVPVEIDSRSHSNMPSPGNFEPQKSVKASNAPVELP